MLDTKEINQINLTRKYIKLKILEDREKFRGHSNEKQHIYDIMKRTIQCGESHSALVIGPRGCGKTTLINTVLEELYNNELVDMYNDVIVVKLNGNVHSDDKIALKSITAQMHLENVVGDKVFGTFAENLQYLLECIKSGVDRTCKSILFILDEFDMFCHSGGITQNLLYNLFDITHNKLSPMCVLGVTCRLDVIEMLEKRVKSRFSHRHVFILPNENSELTPVENLIQLTKDLLSLPLSSTKKNTLKLKKIKTDRFVIASDVTKLSDSVGKRCKVDLKIFDSFDVSFVSDWNRSIDELVTDECFIDAVEKFCYYSVNEQIFRNVLFSCVCKLSPATRYIEAKTISDSIDNSVMSQHRQKHLLSLSVLELSLVIAMKHHLTIFDGQPMNFEMVLHRYTKFANTNSSSQTVPKPVILKAFEHLQSLEIIVPVALNNSRIQKEYHLFGLNVPISDIDIAVSHYNNLPTEITHWASSSIV